MAAAKYVAIPVTDNGIKHKIGSGVRLRDVCTTFEATPRSCECSCRSFSHRKRKDVRRSEVTNAHQAVAMGKVVLAVDHMQSDKVEKKMNAFDRSRAALR